MASVAKAEVTELFVEILIRIDKLRRAHITNLDLKSIINKQAIIASQTNPPYQPITITPIYVLTKTNISTQKSKDYKNHMDNKVVH